MKKVFSALFIVSILFAGNVTAGERLPLSFTGQFGYALPQGNMFETEAGDNMTRFGLSFDADALWHLQQTNYRLGVGFAINSAILFGADLEGFSNIGLYGLSLYGVRGYYRFFNSRVSPFGTLTLGLSQFSTPEITIGDTVIPSESAFNFGVRPEIGIEFGAFVLSVSYMLPMNYTINDLSGSAGSWQIALGTRISLFNRN